MVQNAHVLSSASSLPSYEASSAELDRLLSRLQQSTFRSGLDQQHRLRTNEFERAKLESNLSYARATLTRLEQDAIGIKAPNKRIVAQTDLNRKRELLNTLLDRLEDIKKLAIDQEVSDEDEDEEDEDDPEGEADATPAAGNQDTQPQPDDQQRLPEVVTSRQSASPHVTAAAVPPAPQSASPIIQAQPTQISQTVRSRRPKEPGSPGSVTSQNSYASARASLFASRSKSKPAESKDISVTAEAILDRQRHEQEAITGSMLDIAQRLKASTMSISSELEADKEIVGKASEGLNSSHQGMEAATGKMGTLKRASGGEGLFGLPWKLLMWAKIAGMMFLLMSIMVFMPKFRF